MPARGFSLRLNRISWGSWPKKSKKINAVKAAPKPNLPLIKHEDNPIISPIAQNGWEAWQTFNPGAILIDDTVHFLYRAIGQDGISRLGYAVSGDGLHIDDRLPYPVYEHKIKEPTPFMYGSGGSWGGAEDPRIVHIKDDGRLYMTYTACDGGLRVGLTSIAVNDVLQKKWNWKTPVLISPPDEVHKNWLIFPEKIHGKYAILHSIKPTIQIAYVDNLDFNGNEYIQSFYGGAAQKDGWDTWLRGAGAPPLKTRDGWLLFYHALDDDWSKYKVGVMLLDLDDPTKVLCRAKEPILMPQEPYENSGYKPGIVYVSGAVVRDGTLLVYYGCADSYVGVASANLDEFVRALKQNAAPKLSIKTIKRK